MEEKVALVVNGNTGAGIDNVVVMPVKDNLGIGAMDAAHPIFFDPAFKG